MKPGQTQVGWIRWLPGLVVLRQYRAGWLPSEIVAGLVLSTMLIPVGMANGGGDELARAVEAGLAIVQIGIGRGRGVDRPSVSAHPAPAAQPAPVAPPARKERRPEPKAVEAEPHVASVTVKQPVRGGQVIYAQRSDLVVLAPVNAGVQVIADGHVHVYGPLRGRALAGAQGMEDARVFCQSLEAELLSVAGQYCLADEIPVDRRGKPTQVFVENGSFHFLPI